MIFRRKLHNVFHADFSGVTEDTAAGVKREAAAPSFTIIFISDSGGEIFEKKY
ncbi:MAG: hypothetical protein LBP79_04210 [Clostridiales bacterium]|jgi:hypothetical protein|nr:hypothetical protein [Clostridiales bacterium]